MPVARAELITDMGGNTGLDAACTERNQALPDQQAHTGIVYGKGEMAQAINGR